MSVASVLVPAAVGASVSSVIQLGAWLLVRRKWEEVADLSKKVDDLETQRVAVVEKRLDGAAKSRRDMHQDISDCVKWEDCRREKGEVVKRLDEMRDTALAVERASTKLDVVSKRTEEMFNRVINAKADVSALEARVHNLEQRPS